MWNELRNPNWSARTPPTRSPAISPEKIELDSSPRANPCFSRGVLHATRVVDAAIVPVKHPWKKRSARNCQTLLLSPMRPRTTVPMNAARSTIFLRPKRSATHPHSGAATMKAACVRSDESPA